MPVPSKSPKDLAQVLKKILSEHCISTQYALCAQLQRHGFEVNQAKISRLLRKLGVIKIKDASGMLIYRMPRDPVPPGSKSTLTHLVLSVSTNESLVVVHTSPGSASLIARMLDHHQHDLGILGIVAGDDTLFIAPKTTATIQSLQSRVKACLSHL